MFIFSASLDRDGLLVLDKLLAELFALEMVFVLDLKAVLLDNN